jgi:hypothetical protein
VKIEEAGRVRRWREMEIWSRRSKYIDAYFAIFFLREGFRKERVRVW